MGYSISFLLLCILYVTFTEKLRRTSSLVSYPYAKTRSRELSNKILQNSEALPPTRRRYTSGVREVVVSCTISTFANPTSTRLVPPVTWLTASGSRVKVLHSLDPITVNTDSTSLSRQTTEIQNNNIIQSSVLEISVSRERIDKTLSLLRMNGFKKEDISRLLDKGPWILAFDLTTSLPKLFIDLRTDLQLNQTQAAHVISHCPFLLAQYCQFKGRDVSTTARALIEVGYSSNSLIEDIMRFPSILASPPDRIKGWASLLRIYGIGVIPGTFGKMLKRAPFMFYIDPPILFDIDTISDKYRSKSDDKKAKRLLQQQQQQQQQNGTIAQNNQSSENSDINSEYATDINNQPKSTINGYAHDEAISILNTMLSFQIADIDKIIRSQPYILLESESEVRERLNFIFNLFVDTSPKYVPTTTGTTGTGTSTSTSSSGLSGTTNTANIKYNNNINSNNNNNKNNKNKKSIKTNQQLQMSNTIPTQSSTVSTAIDIDFDNSNSNSNTILQSQSLTSLLDDTLQTIVNNSNSLLLAYPTILSIPYKNLFDISTYLQSIGFRRNQIVQLVRKQPSVFRVDVYDLQLVVSFLRYYCSFRKYDMVTFLIKFPIILESRISDLDVKIDYLCETLGGSTELIKTTPSYLVYNFNNHIRLRAEFMQAMGFSPLQNGLDFLLLTNSQEFSKAVNSNIDLFGKFKTVYFENVNSNQGLQLPSSSANTNNNNYNSNNNGNGNTNNGSSSNNNSKSRTGICLTYSNTDNDNNIDYNDSDSDSNTDSSTDSNSSGSSGDGSSSTYYNPATVTYDNNNNNNINNDDDNSNNFNSNNNIGSSSSSSNGSSSTSTTSSSSTAQSNDTKGKKNINRNTNNNKTLKTKSETIKTDSFVTLYDDSNIAECSESFDILFELSEHDNFF